jgi:hypothetical protein
MTNTTLIMVLAACASAAYGGGEELRNAFEFVVGGGTPYELKPAEDLNRCCGNVLERVLIQKSLETSFIVSGQVVNANLGSPSERVFVLIGIDKEKPKLAALTNVDGEFRFRLWIKKGQRDEEIQVLDDFSGFLYLADSLEVTLLRTGVPKGTKFEQIPNPFFRRYSLKRLVELYSEPQVHPLRDAVPNREAMDSDTNKAQQDRPLNESAVR